MKTRTAQQKLVRLRKALQNIVNYPPVRHFKRTEEGYPEVFTYDKAAYQGMIDSYRDAIRAAIAESRPGKIEEEELDE